MDKHEHIAEIVNLLHAHGIRQVVTCPGSRNAPLALAFTRHGGFSVYPIVDERSAAFYALGMAQQSRQIVALLSTSGSACLNFSPAIAEAYYQHIPLLVLTADRPQENIDQLDGQMLKQQGQYNNFIRRTFQLPINDNNSAEIQRIQHRTISVAIAACRDPFDAPVHVNIPLREPLYEQKGKTDFCPSPILFSHVEKTLAKTERDILKDEWGKYSKILILVGQHPHCSDLQHALQLLSKIPQVVVLSESTSNVKGAHIHTTIDRLLCCMPEKHIADYSPELVITLGRHLISRLIKQVFKKHPPLAHWHVNEGDDVPDYFMRLQRLIPMKATPFLQQLSPCMAAKDSHYADLWNALETEAAKRHEKSMMNAAYTDLKVFETICKSIPSTFQVHLANSTAIRYFQLFKREQSNPCFCNRGLSGIDGSMSTACGAAIASQQATLLITGDLAFFYDSNALWNKFIPASLRIIIINNGGGGIFRFLKGAAEQAEAAELLQMQQNYSAEHLAKCFDIAYCSTDNLDKLEQTLNDFYDMGTQAKILEIITDGEQSGKCLQRYFSNLRLPSLP